MTAAIREFGTREPDVDYRIRPGGYVVLRNDTGNVAVIATPGGLLLPGGGQDPREAPEEAAICETLEECGVRIRPDELIGVADELVFEEEEDGYFRKRCSVFKAAVLSCGAETVAEYQVLWMSPCDAEARLPHGSGRSNEHAASHRDFVSRSHIFLSAWQNDPGGVCTPWRHMRSYRAAP
jgi:8-oxo-dGTP diphosphatase